MRPEQPKKLKQILREHLIARNTIWHLIVGRLQLIKSIARRGDHRLLLHLVDEIEAHQALTMLYRSVIAKRNNEDCQEQPYTPIERPSVDIQERLRSGLTEKLFQTN